MTTLTPTRLEVALLIFERAILELEEQTQLAAICIALGTDDTGENPDIVIASLAQNTDKVWAVLCMIVDTYRAGRVDEEIRDMSEPGPAN